HGLSGRGCSGGGDGVSSAIERISALLIKAERTDNPHEADAYLMKAQALATMASIDIAAARAQKIADKKPTSPVTRTVSIGDKGKRANTHLISLFVAIAYNNFAVVDVASDSTYVVAYGMPQDLDATHTLFASLSVQMVTSAQRYLEKNEWKSDTYRTRSRRTGLPVKKPFTRQTARAAFYRAYVTRIDERLQQARDDAVRSRDESRGDEPSAALVLRESEAEVRAFHQENSDARGRWGGYRGAATGRSGSAAGAGRTAASRARLRSSDELPKGRRALP
ncbi:MAG: DUF2786 domain-containing protein, partial [Candidatus Nanopelagicales bacterium]|nr:DUF2786 domain-containing protein [Candidatus Nanopelagicales bacterium]